jgi:hypothetical protein
MGWGLADWRVNARAHDAGVKLFHPKHLHMQVSLCFLLVRGMLCTDCKDQEILQKFRVCGWCKAGNIASDVSPANGIAIKWADNV